MKNENGQEKSAILKGQTLVNLSTVSTLTSSVNNISVYDLKDKCKYLFKCDVSNPNNCQLNINFKFTDGTSGYDDVFVEPTFTKGSILKIFNFDFVDKIIKNFNLYIANNDGITLTNIQLIEYQEGMENWDIPYFEGMSSVKMPVLTTTGKNLFDGNLIGGYFNNNISSITGDDGKYKSIKIKLNKGTYTLSFERPVYVIREIIDGVYNQNVKTVTTYTFTLNTDGYYGISFRDAVNGTIWSQTQVMIEQGTVATSYEPYKSNILSTSDDVELRGIGKGSNRVEDELDCLTGVVTQRIGEVVLDGSENWTKDMLQDNDTFLNIVFKTPIDNIIDYNDLTTGMLSSNFKQVTGGSLWSEDVSGIGGAYGYIKIGVKKSYLTSSDLNGFKQWLSQNPVTVQYQLKTPTIKPVDLSIKDQDNQHQERMKIYPSGYINTSSSTFLPILELKGITRNNKLNMTTTNGTNNTQLATLDNLALDGIICNNGTVVRDSYDVESGLYTKRVFRATIDEEFINNYTWNITLPSNYQVVQFSRLNPLPKPYNVSSVIGNNIITAYAPDFTSVELATNNNIYIRIRKEELKSYDVDGLLDWIKRNGNIEIAYQMAEPQIIHMQPNMQPYVSTRPYQGSIESQGNILESSFLDYTSEQSIISPKPLGDGDVLRWEQGSQCYVYENDKEYIPLTNYNQPMGTVLDLEEEDGEQFVENLDGGDIIVDVPFKEKAVYERHLVSHEDNVIYPTQDKLDPTGKIEVDYICGETWQNPNDLSDIRHVGTLREDGQYDVTIRRSGDDEIRLMDGTTHISLDGDGTPPSEFELTYYNQGGVEVGKYGDISHTLEDCVLDSKLETGMVYGNTETINSNTTSTIINGFITTNEDETQSITYTLSTPITLNKVGDVCDTFDVVGGVETRRCYPTIDDINYYVDVNVKNWTMQKTRTNTILFGMNDPYKWKNTDNYCWNSIGIPSENINIWDNDVEGIQFANNSDIRFSILRSELDSEDVDGFVKWVQARDIKIRRTYNSRTIPTFQHTLIPSTVEPMQEPTFILPQPLRSVPNGICDRLYWDENKGHYCIEKRIGVEVFDGVNNFNLDVNDGQLKDRFDFPLSNSLYVNNAILCYYTNSNVFPQLIYDDEYNGKQGMALFSNGRVYFRYNSKITNAQFKQLLIDNPVDVIYSMSKSQIIDLPYLNKKLTLPTQPDVLPIGYKVEYPKANPQLGLTIPYKQLNYPSRPQNIDFKMDIADYVLTWDDVKEARQYNIILNDKVIATTKEPQWNSGEEMYGYIMVEAQNELAENLSEELYIKTVPNAPAQLTVAHNPMTDYYDFEISFIKTSAIAEYYTVQYRIDGGEWVYKTIQSSEIDPNSKVLWSFSVYEINEQIEVWATATNDIGTNDILPTAIYYMSPTPQWTYRINSKELFVRWMDDSPYDVQYKLRYQYKSDGIFRYAYFEGDKQEVGKLYEALIPLADDEEISIALCVISEKENLYTKPIKASKELDPNIKPPKNFNYHWLARGLIEFYWEDNYDVDIQYEAIVEHRMSGEQTWIQDTQIFDSTDVSGVGTVYRLEYQLEELEEIRVKVRMKWAMNETEWSESLTTVFIPVEGNPPTWIRRTQTQQGLLVEWEPQQYVDSYHVYVMSNGEELQHLETMDNFIYVDIDYSNPIDIEIYEATRFTGGVNSDPSESMRFRPTMDKQQLIHNVVTPDTLTYEIEVDTIQKGIKERQLMHHINTTPNVKDKQPMDVTIKSPFTLSYHPLRLDVHQAGSKYYGDTELHIKTLNVKSRDAIEVLSFERITDQYGVDFTVYTPSASKYPITLEVNRVRIVCFGDSLTSGHPGFWAETGTGDPQHCYEYWLDRRLKGQYEIINKGYGSDTTDRMLARFDRDVLANNPQYCIIQGGTNDLYWAMAESMGDQEALDMKLDVMKANIMEMVKRCWDNNIIPIVGNLIPRTGATGIYKTALYDFNAWIISWCTEQAAEGRNIFYVDLFNAGKEAVPPTPIEDPTNPGAMNPIYDGDALFDEFGNIIKQGRGIHLNKEGYRIWAEAIPLSIFKTYDSGLRMYKDLHCTDEDNYDDSDKQNPFYTISIDNVRRSKTKTVVRYIKNIGKTQVLFAMYASDEYNMSIEFVGSDGEKGAYANGLLAPNMIAKVTMEINLDNKDSKASFNLHLAAREYNQN